MSFEFESVNQFSAEVEQDSAVQPQHSPANSVAEELNRPLAKVSGDL